MLTDVYVLLPVLDNRKHYWIGDPELEKLMAHGKGWLEDHPHRDLIVQRYLGHRQSLTSEAISTLEAEQGPAEDPADPAEDPAEGPADEPAETPEETARRKSLHEQRLDWVESELRDSGAERVVDLGCGEGRLLRRRLDEPRYREIVGADVSARSLEIARRRLGLRKMKAADRNPSACCRRRSSTATPGSPASTPSPSSRSSKHVEPARLDLFQRNLFDSLQPRTVVLDDARTGSTTSGSRTCGRTACGGTSATPWRRRTGAP